MTQPAQAKPHLIEQSILTQPEMTNTAQFFAEKISRLNAEQIELIGMELVFLIPANLGPVGKAKVEQIVKQKQKPDLDSLSETELMMLVAKKIACDEAIQLGELEFFQGNSYEEFTTQMHRSIKAAIEAAFSTPLFFLQHGMSIQLSDYEAQDILWDVCEKTNIDIGFNVPMKYFIELNLDSKLSFEQSTLVFALTQKSNGVEFSRRIFTMDELEKALSI